MILAIIGVTVLVALLIGFIVVLFQHNRDLREELDILKEDRQPLLNQIRVK